VFVTWVECDVERKMMLNKKMLMKENRDWVKSELETLTSSIQSWYACNKDLQESFDDKDLYMYNKQEKQMIKTLKCKSIYIVKKIANNLDEFALLSAMQYNVSSAFSAMHSSMNLDDSMNLNHFISHIDVIYHENEIKVDHDQLSFANDKSFKLYKL